MQQKSQRPVQFEITGQNRQTVEAWIGVRGLKPADYLFPGRRRVSPHLPTRQCTRLAHRWTASFWLDGSASGAGLVKRIGPTPGYCGDRFAWPLGMEPVSADTVITR